MNLFAAWNILIGDIGDGNEVVMFGIMTKIEEITCETVRPESTPVMLDTELVHTHLFRFPYTGCMLKLGRRNAFSCLLQGPC